MIASDETLTVFAAPATLEERLCEALVNAPAEPTLEDLLTEGTLLLKALQAQSLRGVLPAALQSRTERLLAQLLEACAARHNAAQASAA